MRPESYGEHGERRLDALLARLRRRHVDPHVEAGSVLVDLGCGHGGTLLKTYSGAIARGIGFDVAVGPAPAENIELHSQRVDARLPIEDASADVVSCLAVIEHVERPDVLVAEARRILRPQGVFVVTTPAAQAKPIMELISVRLGLIDPTEILDHKRYYRPSTLREELAQAGFAQIRVRRFELGLNLAAVARR
jgi:2-polyprenyl-6-hydroxyphenyl methylase / 3-demethylubiquinone-9 3-methyltransferase